MVVDEVQQVDDEMNTPPPKEPTQQRIGIVDNQLQTHVHQLGHVVKRTNRVGSASKEELVEMESLYSQARTRALEYEGMQGDLPVWAGKDWVGRENWHDGGPVRELMNRVKGAEGQGQRVALEQLNSEINRFVE